MIWILFIATMALSLWRRAGEGGLSPLQSGHGALRVVRRRSGGFDSPPPRHSPRGDHPRGRHVGRSLRPDPQAARVVLQQFLRAHAGGARVAAHECGHAIQHARAYKPLHWRMAAVGLTTYANYIVMFLPLLGIATGLLTPVFGRDHPGGGMGCDHAVQPRHAAGGIRCVAPREAVLADFGFIAPGEEATGVRKCLMRRRGLTWRVYHVAGVFPVALAAAAAGPPAQLKFGCDFNTNNQRKTMTMKTHILAPVRLFTCCTGSRKNQAPLRRGGGVRGGRCGPRVRLRVRGGRSAGASVRQTAGSPVKLVALGDGELLINVLPPP